MLLIQMNVISDKNQFETNFPLFAAVNRAASSELHSFDFHSSMNVDRLDVNRHQGRLIFLEYQGEGEIDSTVLLVGKDITYDTGGLDIKSRPCSTLPHIVILIVSYSISF
jgi:leucyl aminopeptidase